MILVISDYHGHEQEVISLIKRFNPEKVLCLGDGQSSDDFYVKNAIISVKGNCDTAELPIIEFTEINGKKALLTHGHMYDVIFGINKLYYLAKENQCEYLLYGHTHIQNLEVYDGITFLNPGSLLDDRYALIDEENIILK